MIDDGAYVRAKRRVNAKIGFYAHLAIYLTINISLIFINLTTSTDYLWYKWPIFGWGIGLIFHGLSVFFLTELSTHKKSMIEKEMEKEELQL